MNDNEDTTYNSKMSSRNTKAQAVLSRCGYKKGGVVTEKVKKGVHEHESNMHKGKKETKLHLKEGGKVSGECAKPRLDKYARGGGTKSKGGHTKVNVIVAPQGGGQGAAQQMPPRPPMMPPQGGAPMPPPQRPPMMPPQSGVPMRPPMKRGGGIKLPGGSGGGLARIAKIKDYGAKPVKK